MRTQTHATQAQTQNTNQSVLVWFSIFPLGAGPHTSEELAEALQLVAESGLPYQLTASGTCVEGPWEQVMALVQRCHARVREHAPHVVTTLQIEDDMGEREKLTQNVESVAEKAPEVAAAECRAT